MGVRGAARLGHRVALRRLGAGGFGRRRRQRQEGKGNSHASEERGQVVRRARPPYRTMESQVEWGATAMLTITTSLRRSGRAIRGGRMFMYPPRMLADRRALSRRWAANLSTAGKPLLVRYDLDAVAPRLRRESAHRAGGMWKWRELLPLPESADPVSLGEPETPIIPLDHTAAPAGAALVVKDEGAADRFVQGAGNGDGGHHGETFRIKSVALPTNGNAGAALAAYAARAGMEAVVICPGRNAGNQRPRNRRLRRARVGRRRADRRMRRI